MKGYREGWSTVLSINRYLKLPFMKCHISILIYIATSYFSCKKTIFIGVFAKAVFIQEKEIS